MQVNVKDQTVVATMTEREAGKIIESLSSIASLPKELAPLKDLFDGISVPAARRGELRHEWGDPLDMDPDIGPA
ncbi:hypothetical protein A6M27_03920 [Acidithiobacillus thiooxidans]|jgi:hypothetical protein|uniref:Uncharacterized protein n=2 Tax=Acidithiobacillus thiooxidans TaxID=930 RepID=A0A1C2ISF8_ACITH|nr:MULTISPECIES: hypothetical protein [Acidithiobacillus]MBU2835652.1 hypothetical protein [Acidithiobacillus thiooxidans]MDD5278026.1 hypothetical protein [Acidithiobacillus sp.]OCX72411.1 hypothetical protein A6P07_09930 [Acidithiobacillus thiooxidans]OCX74018.1 hypothetical protein A6M23_07185 [Acidithiobacillus thiooxidans]OCX78939.1 hypothetical protein A6O24_03125 [Acidithiobacillus thiooxidans]